MTVLSEEHDAVAGCRGQDTTEYREPQSYIWESCGDGASLRGFFLGCITPPVFCTVLYVGGVTGIKGTKRMNLLVE